MRIPSRYKTKFPRSFNVLTRQTAFSLCAMISLLAVGAQAQAPITAAPRALMSTDAGIGWQAEANLQIGSREFNAASTLLETDLRIISARVGFDLLPFLQPWLEAGTSKADRDDFDGENGLFAGAGVRAELLQWVLSGNPSLPRKRTLTLGGEAGFRSYESNSAEADFNWNEFEFVPGVTYSNNQLGNAEWIPYRPIETMLHGGLVFSTIDGEFGGSDVEGNRNFAFRLGATLLWQNAITTKLSGTFFGDKDRLVSLGLGYQF